MVRLVAMWCQRMQTGSSRSREKEREREIANKKRKEGRRSIERYNTYCYTDSGVEHVTAVRQLYDVTAQCLVAAFLAHTQ